MKRILTLILLLPLISGEAAALSYVINVHASDPALEGCTVTLRSSGEGYIIDSQTIEGGKTTFEGEADYQALLLVHARTADNRNLHSFCIAEPTATDIDLATDSLISGGGLNRRLRELEAAVSNAADISEAKALSLKAIRENPDNGVGERAMGGYAGLCSPDEWDEVSAILGPHVKETEAARINDLEFRRMRPTWIGRPFADITGRNTDGSEAKLSDYVGRGSYVLADFWASWCGGCIDMTTHYLMPLYKRYRDDERFEIVGVAVSDDPEKTLRAIGRHGYRWPQLTGCGDAPMKAYGFRSIPQLILFGPDGTVIARNTTVTDIIKQIDAALGK